jgi:hypothetical protein
MSRVLRTLGVLAVLTLVAGLLGMGATTAVAADPDPLAGAPAAGACYALSLKQAYRPVSPEAPVACRGRHTMVVTAVGRIPASLDWTTVDFAKRLPLALVRAINATCNPAARRLIGPDRARSMTLYQDYWFAPSTSEVAAGARWFSCLVALTETTKLVPLPKGLPTKLGRRVPNKIARCAKTTKAGFPTVACTRPHQWRTAFAKVVHAPLTNKSYLRAARRTCPKHVTGRTWLYAVDPVSLSSFVVSCSIKNRR